jgi:ElaB/YqjD/DUF883 family membrane-anchored ribosome-binding protein
MYSHTAKVRDTANDLLDGAKDLLNSAAGEFYKTATRYGKKVEKNYPIVLSNVRDTASDAAKYSRASLISAGETLGSAAEQAGDAIRAVEKSVLRIGLVYAVYKLFIADDKKVYEATQKVKTIIREKPVQSAAIALGAGYLVGKLFRS